MHLSIRVCILLGVATLSCTNGALAAVFAEAAQKIDDATMQRAGELAYAREVQRARAQNTVDSDSEKARRIRRVANPLILQAGRLNGEKRWSWALTVEARDEPIAYCLPGGRIIVSTAMLDRVKLTDPELAAVIAHAIAHALAGHDADEAAAQLSKQADGIPADPNRVVLMLADILAQLVQRTPHGADAERAADGMSLELMARSGVDPHAAVDAWRKVLRAGGAAPPAFLALNPPWLGRIEEIEAQVPSAMPAYTAATTPAPVRPRSPKPR